MKKLISFVILLSTVACSTVPHSQRVEEVEPGFVILDVLFYRPVGLLATVIGTGAFIGISPLTAFASIPAPHDAFIKTGKILVLSPAAYTFIRPVGDRDFPYHLWQSKQKPVATINNVDTYNRAVTPNKRPVLPPETDAQPLQRYPDAGGL